MAKRMTSVSQIRGFHSMTLRVKSESKLVNNFSVNVADLDGVWMIFKVENDSMLLKKIDLYSPNLQFEVLSLVNTSKTLATSLIPE